MRPVSQSPTPLQIALESLGGLVEMDASARAVAAQALETHSQPHRASADLGDSGDERCWFLIDGWACRARLMRDGRRQIFDFLMPGDVVGLRTNDEPSGLYRIIALTPGATLIASALRRYAQEGQIGVFVEAGRQAEVRQAVSFYAHMTRLGARTAHDAAADLFHDLYRRAEAFGRCEGGRFAMPLSQSVLGDALGITPIQMNRILSRLRSGGLIRFGSGWVEIPDPAALRLQTL